jgi:hypothetical protein
MPESKAINISSVTQGRQVQFIQSDIEQIDYTVVANTKAEFLPALKASVRKGFQPPPQFANISNYPRSSSGR